MKKLITISLIILSQSCFSADILELKKISWGLANRQGRRSEMEDTHIALINIDNNPIKAFFGLYDGHGGTRAARAAAGWYATFKPLHLQIIKSKEPEPQRSYNAYHTLNNQMMRIGNTSGTTALTAFIEEKQGKPVLNVAWAGDSRAILIDKKGAILEATEDHKPEEYREANRIRKAGGKITGDLRGYPITWRTEGGISISRTIGDKKDKALKNAQGALMGTIATPEVKQIELNPNARALIMGCDGLWDVMNNEEVAEFVIDLLKEDVTSGSSDYGPTKNEFFESMGSNKTPKAIAEVLRDYAFTIGSTDNISVLIVLFDWQAAEPKDINIGDLTTILEHAQTKLIADDAKELVGGWLSVLKQRDGRAPVAYDPLMETVYEESFERYKENLMREDGSDDEILNHLYQTFDTAYHDKVQFARRHIAELQQYLNALE